MWGTWHSSDLICEYLTGLVLLLKNITEKQLRSQSLGLNFPYIQLKTVLSIPVMNASGIMTKLIRAEKRLHNTYLYSLVYKLHWIVKFYISYFALQLTNFSCVDRTVYAKLLSLNKTVNIKLPSKINHNLYKLQLIANIPFDRFLVQWFFRSMNTRNLLYL